MIEVSGSEVDQPTLDRWINRLDAGAEWAKARRYEEQE